MDLSICIVTHNSAFVAPRCLQSIRERPPHLDYEVIVIDNASTDQTTQVIESEFPSARLLRSDRNTGFAAANNRAVAQARGEFILLLNPDTEVTGGAIDRMVDFIRKHPWAGAVGPRLTFPDGSLQFSCHDTPDIFTAAYGALGLAQLCPRCQTLGRYDMTWWDHAEARSVGWVSGAALLFTRKAWESVGPLDQGFFMYWEDADWQMRLRRGGLECWYVPEAEIIHHEAASWTTGGRGLMRTLVAHWSAFRFYRRFYGYAGEFALRGLTALGALGRALGWLALWLARGCRSQEAERLAVHLEVLKLATGITILHFGRLQPSPETEQS